MLIEKSRLAKNRQDLNEVSKALCNLVTTMNSIPKRKYHRNRFVCNEQRMTELHEALRTAQPGPEPREYYGWHAPGDRPGTDPYCHRATSEKQQHIEYIYTQLRKIGNLPKYRPITETDPQFCFKNGVFFPFSKSAPVDHWYECNNQAFFETQFRTKDRVCDRATKFHTPTSAHLMMFQTYRNCLNMALKNGRKEDGIWTIQDPLGLEPWPFLDTPWTGSIGHIIHGQPMITGYPPGEAYPEDQENYDESRNNMAWETWGWNHEKQSMGDEPDLEKKILLRHQNLRSPENVKRFWEVMDDVRVDPDYFIKINDARRRWTGNKQQHLDRDIKKEEEEVRMCVCGGIIHGDNIFGRGYEDGADGGVGGVGITGSGGDAGGVEITGDGGDAGGAGTTEGDGDPGGIETTRGGGDSGGIETTRGGGDAGGAGTTEGDGDPGGIETTRGGGDADGVGINGENGDIGNAGGIEATQNNGDAGGIEATRGAGNADGVGINASEQDKMELCNDYCRPATTGENGNTIPNPDHHSSRPIPIMPTEDAGGDKKENAGRTENTQNKNPGAGQRDFEQQSKQTSMLNGEGEDSEDEEDEENQLILDNLFDSQDDEDDEDDFELQENREEIDEMYAFLDTINTTASEDLIELIHKTTIKHGSSQQSSTQQRRASFESADQDIMSQRENLRLHINSQRPRKPYTKRRRVSSASNTGDDQAAIKRPKTRSSDELWSLVDDFKNAESMSSGEFVAKSHQMSDLFRRRLELRERYPDGSLGQAMNKGESEISHSATENTAQELTDCQLHRLCISWHCELVHQIKKRRQDMRRRELSRTELTSESMLATSLESLIQDMRDIELGSGFQRSGSSYTGSSRRGFVNV